jgi:acyl-coenzyme A thioesterase PaaI-like protein
LRAAVTLLRATLPGRGRAEFARDDVTATLVTATLAHGDRCATLSLHTSFLRPASLGTLLGRAKLVRRGKGVCNVQGELWQQDKLVATASAVCMIVGTLPAC